MRKKTTLLNHIVRVVVLVVLPFISNFFIAVGVVFVVTSNKKVHKT